MVYVCAGLWVIIGSKSLPNIAPLIGGATPRIANITPRIISVRQCPTVAEQRYCAVKVMSRETN